MRLLLIGDIVGKPGRQIVVRSLPGLIAREGLDLVVANGENAAGGSGITPAIYHELIGAGVDVVTLGDHIYKRIEIEPILRTRDNIVKPANFPAAAPGRDFAVATARNGVRVAVISLMGRVFMRPVDCPFQAADRVLAQIEPEVRVRLVDFHAEATSDKQLMGRYLDGRVTRRPRYAHPRRHGRRATLSRRHGVSMRCRHDWPPRKHPGSADRPRARHDADIQPEPFRRSYRRRAAPRHAG